MKKINQTSWSRYKNSAEGKDALAVFQRMNQGKATVEEVFQLSKKYNPAFFDNQTEEEEIHCLDNYLYVDERIGEILRKLGKNEDFTYLNLFESLTLSLSGIDTDSVDDLKDNDYKQILWLNTFASMLLYMHSDSFFIPYLFVMQFPYLERFAEKYEIELPKVPHRKDYRERWYYYLSLCDILDEFAEENNIQSNAELATFIYDYELPMIKEEVDGENGKEIPEVPGQAWILVGNYGKGEKTMDAGFWQANEFTEKGDILLFYEKSPVKALNAVWIALRDGVRDPFFHYYSHTYMGRKIEIPADKAISFEDFKNSEYFKNKPSKGNYVSKNFQDVSGWPVSYEDYEEIKRILKNKGFDVEQLPKLYEPEKIGDFTIAHEKDVSEHLLIPLLEQMGWKHKVDFFGEVEFPAGRGTTNYATDKRPDFCLHVVEANDDIEAKVAIEVKRLMKNENEIHANFVQGRSYAKWGN